MRTQHVAFSAGMLRGDVLPRRVVLERRIANPVLVGNPGHHIGQIQGMRVRVSLPAPVLTELLAPGLVRRRRIATFRHVAARGTATDRNARFSQRVRAGPPCSIFNASLRWPSSSPAVFGVFTEPPPAILAAGDADVALRWGGSQAASNGTANRIATKCLRMKISSKEIFMGTCTLAI